MILSPTFVRLTHRGLFAAVAACILGQAVSCTPRSNTVAEQVTNGTQAVPAILHDQREDFLGGERRDALPGGNFPFDHIVLQHAAAAIEGGSLKLPLAA